MGEWATEEATDGQGQGRFLPFVEAMVEGHLEVTEEGDEAPGDTHVSVLDMVRNLPWPPAGVCGPGMSRFDKLVARVLKEEPDLTPAGVVSYLNEVGYDTAFYLAAPDEVTAFWHLRQDARLRTVGDDEAPGRAVTPRAQVLRCTPG